MTDSVSSTAWAAAQLHAWEVDVPDAADHGDRLRDWLESGVPALTGRRDGGPLVPPGAAATAALGCELAFAALRVADPHRTWHHLLGARAALTGGQRRGPWSIGGSARTVRCSDGFLAVNLARREDVESVAAVVEHDQTVDVDDAWRLLVEWAASKTTGDAAARLQLLDVPGGVVPDEGSWWRDSAATEVGARNPVACADIADHPRRRSEPLVVDLSSLWAGPLCAHLLGRAGAQVVKVELADRLDGARGGNSEFYDFLHGGHDSVVLDLSQRSDHDLLGGLLTDADIVIESSRPRALQRWGIDATDFCRRTPTTWVSITAYGRRFPDRIGFGDDVAMASGLVARVADDDWPLPCGDAIADPLTGMHAAVQALAAHRAGGSRLLDVAMSEVVASALAWAPGGARAVESAPAPSAPEVIEAAAAAGRDTAKWRSR